MRPNSSCVEVTKPPRTSVAKSAVWFFEEGVCWPSSPNEVPVGDLHPVGTAEMFSEYSSFHTFPIYRYIFKLSLAVETVGDEMPELVYLDHRPGPICRHNCGRSYYGYWVQAMDPILQRVFFFLVDYEPGSKQMLR